MSVLMWMTCFFLGLFFKFFICLLCEPSSILEAGPWVIKWPLKGAICIEMTCMLGILAGILSVRDETLCVGELHCRVHNKAYWTHAFLCVFFPIDHSFKLPLYYDITLIKLCLYFGNIFILTCIYIYMYLYFF